MSWDWSSCDCWRSTPACYKDWKNLSSSDLAVHLDLIHMYWQIPSTCPSWTKTFFFSFAHPAIFPFLNFSACLEVPRIYFRLPYIYDISLISIYMLFSTLQPPPLPFSDNFFLPPILWLLLIVSGNDVCYDTLCAINIYLILPAWLVHLRAGIMILLCNTELSFIQKAFNIFIFWVNK